jgi:hypothetical protein
MSKGKSVINWDKLDGKSRGKKKKGKKSRKAKESNYLGFEKNKKKSSVLM